MVPLRSLTTSTLALIAALTWMAPPVSAQHQHRARLGADLKRQLVEGSPHIDVIVEGDQNKVDRLARRYNLRVKKQLRGGAVFSVNAGQLDALSQDEVVDHLAADATVQSSNLTAESIGADQVWAGAGPLKAHSGGNVGVALIDSGIDPKHTALAKRVVFTKDFIGGNGSDPFGHGTHVGSLIAGQGGKTADTRDLTGMAPGTRLVNLRVLDETGAGKASDVIDAIDWVIENRKAFNIRVINLSLGAAVAQSYRDDPLCEAVERAVAAGIVVVAAAGNQGATPDGTPVYGSITSPGNDPSVLTVGAVDMHGTPQRSDDTIAKFSAKGPTRYDLVLKPDLVAPGVRVVSAEAQGSYFSVTYPERHYAGTAQNAFMQLSGTSMAAGVASGAVALLVDAEPKLTPGQVKAALQLTSSLVSGEGMLSSGAGSLNVAGAVAFLAEPNQLTQITIAGEPTTWGGLSTAAEGGLQLLTGLGSSAKGPKGVSRIRAQAAESIVWGNLLGMPILWSGSLVSPSASDSIVWGNASTPWGVALVRGSAVADTIVWGNAADSIVWGNAADSIVWGNAADSIVWGNAADSIVWGNAADSIVWGNAADSIVWGNAADSIVWGNAADSIVWGH